MTNFTRKHGKVDLRPAILACIAAGLQRTDEISAHLNETSQRIATRLAYFRSLGLIHSVRAPDEKKGGSINIWRLGPPLGEYGQPGRAPQGRNCITRVKVILSTTYPLVDRRDPLVAALFGEPRVGDLFVERRAPRCTRCHMEQGAGHQAGCIVAMVAA